MATVTGRVQSESVESKLIVLLVLTVLVFFISCNEESDGNSLDDGDVDTDTDGDIDEVESQEEDTEPEEESCITASYFKYLTNRGDMDPREESIEPYSHIWADPFIDFSQIGFGPCSEEPCEPMYPYSPILIVEFLEEPEKAETPQGCPSPLSNQPHLESVTQWEDYYRYVSIEARLENAFIPWGSVGCDTPDENGIFEGWACDVTESVADDMGLDESKNMDMTVHDTWYQGYPGIPLKNCRGDKDYYYPDLLRKPGQKAILMYQARAIGYCRTIYVSKDGYNLNTSSHLPWRVEADISEECKQNVPSLFPLVSCADMPVPPEAFAYFPEELIFDYWKALVRSANGSPITGWIEELVSKGESLGESCIPFVKSQRCNCLYAPDEGDGSK